ncbi:MAG: SDR family oxidoreductase [Candidatus Eremiobacteraeota bacterium]|nr:SDR family oxidoreductase [Candidatus Eremiobacteraeota bacterium]
MRVAIFGGTGGIGRWLVAIARENGDHVKVLVRDRRKLPSDLGAIGVLEGNVFDREAVATTVGGCDVVFSALGSDGLGRTDAYSRGTANILATMRENGPRRLLVVSSVGVEDDPKLDFLGRRIVMPLLLGNVLADMRVMEREVEASSLIYTIVRPARLSDGPRTGLYRANDRFLPDGGRTISRADVADFMYRIVVDERTLRKTAALAY